MAYTIADPQPGYTPIANVDAGILVPVTVSNGTTTTIPTPPNQLGAIVKAVDPTYGQGEFVFLLGVASLAVGNLVTWNAATYQAVLPTFAQAGKSGESVAFAMSTPTATQYGWFQISGTAVALKLTATAVSANKPIGYISTNVVGRTLTSGRQILNAKSGASSKATGTGVTVVCNRPCIAQS